MFDGFPPSCASRYAFEEVLASGGFGVVCRAHQLSLKRSVAVKILHSDWCRNEDQQRRFLQEARIVATLRSPYIAQVLDHGVDAGIPWIVFELVNGPSLDSVVAQGPLPLSQALTAAAHIAAALEVAHAAGVYHRDVKPENVLMHGADLYKVVDFGIAQWTSAGAIQTAQFLSLLESRAPGSRTGIYDIARIAWALGQWSAADYALPANLNWLRGLLARLQALQKSTKDRRIREFIKRRVTHMTPPDR